MSEKLYCHEIFNDGEVIEEWFTPEHIKGEEYYVLGGDIDLSCFDDDHLLDDEDVDGNRLIIGYPGDGVKPSEVDANNFHLYDPGV